MKEDLNQRAYERCTQMVVLLETHLNQTSVQSDIKSRFYDIINMPLSNDNIDKIRAEVKRYIQGLILEEIQKWEQDSKYYQRTVTMITRNLKRKLSLCEKSLKTLNDLCILRTNPTMISQVCYVISALICE
ncbi:hypothetical protein DPMN_155667 [Dreissena polymorpha]|uniref:Uncharacterized protein n=1 Tax=Dreissena polymorpha TaxID=45954 RepID=A0A9D4FS67_DREPO|nr:hypothetical protein DPMN_155667 [Dreissena polymorpha]